MECVISNCVNYSKHQGGIRRGTPRDLPVIVQLNWTLEVTLYYTKVNFILDRLCVWYLTVMYASCFLL